MKTYKSSYVFLTFAFWFAVICIYLKFNREPKPFEPEIIDNELTFLRKKLSIVQKRSDEAAKLAQKLLASVQIAILVIACNRSEALRNHLNLLIKYRPFIHHFPIIVSQDCVDENTAEVARSFGDQITFVKQPNHSTIIMPLGQPAKYLGYYKICRHYKWALNYVFNELGYENVIITEDDLEISPDFYEYFKATQILLAKDPTIWCVSGWNDNGKSDKIDLQKPDLLYRTDFFPGLGWMLNKKLWHELSPIWPSSFWDDWMRTPKVRKNRVCIRPEISRTSMSKFGETGVSLGTFFTDHLRHIKLNELYVPFTSLDLSYLLKRNYDVIMTKNISKTPIISVSELKMGNLNDGRPLPANVRITYDGPNKYHEIVKQFGLMEDFRSGVPRTGYNGVVTFMHGKTRVFLTYNVKFNGYNEHWN